MIAPGDPRLAHVDPDVAGLLLDLQAQVSAIPPDLTAINAAIAQLQSDVAALKAAPPPPPPPAPVPPPNHPPVWLTVPSVNFAQGVAASFSLAPFVSDADTGDVVTLRLLTGTLPVGVTLDAPNKRLVYDGIGLAGAPSTVTLQADDGRA